MIHGLDTKPASPPVLPLVPTEDKEVTCVACQQSEVDYELRLWDSRRGCTVWYGLHARCVL